MAASREVAKSSSALKRLLYLMNKQNETKSHPNKFEKTSDDELQKIIKYGKSKHMNIGMDSSSAHESTFSPHRPSSRGKLCFFLSWLIKSNRMHKMQRFPI